MGGDEFAIIMTQMEQATDAAALSKHIRESVVKTYQIEGHQIVTDISIGISVAPMDAVESSELIRNADIAIYDAKADGRSTFRFFEPEMNTRMKVRRELEMDLRKALATEQFQLYYPTACRPADQRRQRVRGPAALESPDPRPDFSRRLHHDRGGDRPDHPTRRVGAQGGLRRGG